MMAAADADARAPVADDAAAALAPERASREDDDGGDARVADGGGGGDRAPGSNPNKKRKVALSFAYVGAGYAGMQRNPGVVTIEGELEAAIVKAGGISDANAGDFGKVAWTRAARTDKGVSAVGQVIACRMVLEPEGMLERINEALPEKFEVFGIDRVTGGFNAKTMCDRRRYEYVIPTWAFDPSVGKAASADADAAVSASDAFVFTEKTRARVDAVLKNYCGTHNFHNYTVKVKPTDPQAKRYILSFDCSEPFEVDGEQFVRCTVLGQSFMLHQIRKLIGTMLAVVRGELTEDDQKFALLTSQFAPTPMAPELGLFLCECIYKAYNDKFGAVHGAMELLKYHNKVEAFKHKFVYTHIVNQEREEHTMRDWLRDVLQGGKHLRTAFDASIASSIAAGETLDASRVGVRQKKRKNNASAPAETPDAPGAAPAGSSFEASMAAAAERAKVRRVTEPGADDRYHNNSRPPPAKSVNKEAPKPTTMIPLDEYSD